MWRDHRAYRRDRPAASVRATIAYFGFVHGKDGRAARSPRTRFRRTPETSGRSHVPAERNTRRARIPGKEPDVRESGCEPVSKSSTTEVTEKHRVQDLRCLRWFRIVLYVSRTQFWSLRRRRKRQEGGQRPDLRESHARGCRSHHARFRRQLDAQELDLAYDLRLGLLRHRDDVDGRVALRYRA